MKNRLTFLLFLLPFFLIAQPPANDDCANAEMLTLSMGQVEVVVDITDATDSPEDECDEPGVWYKFTPNASIEGYRITTLNQDGDCDRDDTQLHIFRGADCNTFTELTDGCQDDNNLDCDDHETFVFANTSTEPIYIHVAQDDPDDALIYRLLVEEVELPDNDDCENAQELTLSNGEVSTIVNLENATPDDLEDCDEAGIWYSFVPDASVESYRIITLNEDEDCDNDDTEIHVFRGDDCGNLTELTDGCQDDDNTDCNNHEQFIIANENTDRIYIHVARDDSEDDAVYRLLIEVPPSNDDCAAASPIQLNNDGSAHVKVDLALATSGDLEECDASGVWFSFRLTNTGPVTILTQSFDPNNCDEGDDTEIHVFKGDNCEDLTELTDGCQDEDNTGCENNETFTFDGEPGDVIYIHVGRDNGDDNAQYTLTIDSPEVIYEELPVQNWKQLLGMMMLLISIGTLAIFRLRR